LVTPGSGVEKLIAAAVTAAATAYLTVLVVLLKLRDAIDQQFDCVFEGLERFNGQ
jgi:hypothetical protein